MNARIEIEKDGTTITARLVDETGKVHCHKTATLTFKRGNWLDTGPLFKVRRELAAAAKRSNLTIES